MTIQTSIRDVLKTALDGVSATVYAYVPETVIPPAVVIVPDAPYMEPNIINKSTIKVKLNFTISVAVAYNSNPGSLDNLEQLTMAVLTALPSGYEVGNIQRPTVTQVGPSSLLVADISVSTYYQN